MYNHQKTEEEILKLWKEKEIYKKVRKKNSKGKKFYFMDGPPYATGSIHMGTALNKVLKDIAMRSQRFQGKNVFDRPGYDTHGVPIEFQVEKEIGSTGKEDIEKYGIKKFVQECKRYATRYIGVMNRQFMNLGVWMDWENPYLTLDDKYIEAIWWTFKKAYEKKLLYLGKYPVHVCPRCETAVAFNEIEYTKQEDTSIYVKFPLKKEENKFFIIWTTTPWTLPGNTGIMVNPDFDYSEVELDNGERWIIAKEKVGELMSKIWAKYKVKKNYKGRELEGIGYVNPLAKNMNLNLKNAYKVVLSGRYVNLEEGTGLVHCAPGHGKEDYEVGKEYILDMPSPVGMNGLLTKETGKYQGKKARIVDEEIIKDLENMNMLVHTHKYSHDYPICWRCKTPLLMISVPQWFFKIKSIHSKLLKENRKVEWVPKYMELRMKAWLEGISDWPISRDRYWGTPLPIWKCESCGEVIIVENKKELEKLSGKKIKEIHKPEIDEIRITCKKCKREMRRIPEILDVWFDAGVSSWAALDYPQKKDSFRKFWPADLNIEGKDQFRGWWNAQIILSQIAFDKKPFDAIGVHGMILDLGKRKMSKSRGNVTSPEEIIEKYGRDSLRYFFAKISKGEDFSFDEKEFKSITNFLRVLLNVNNFVNQIGNSKNGNLKIEDKWILSKLNSDIKNITNYYNSYYFPKVVEEIENFLINDVSRTYIQIIRERAEDKAVKYVLNEIRKKILFFLAPIIPFITEEIYQKFGKKDSIFLETWPKADVKKINEKLESKFDVAFQIIEKGLAERDKTKINLRWPLAKVTIFGKEYQLKELEDIIKSQLNVKEIEIKLNNKSKDISVRLDTRITPELEAEGYARELSRQIQAFRKKLGLEKKDKIKTFLIVDDKFKKILEEQKNFIKERTNSEKLEFVTTDKERFKNKTDFTIKDKRGKIVVIQK